MTGLCAILLLELAFPSPVNPAETPETRIIIAGTSIQSPRLNPLSITLYGIPFDNRRLFMTELYLQAGDSEPVKLPAKSGNGYEPRMLTCDFTGDGVDEILITASTGGSGGIVNGIICSIGDDGDIITIFDTGNGVLTPVTGRFTDGYRASINILDTTVVIDLSDRKEYYEKSGVYSNRRPTGAYEPWGDPYGLILPEDTDGNGICELACWQSVSGAAHVDRIALIKSVLSWTTAGWEITALDISPLSDVSE